ncbi:PREDICTED: E3 ubiquitin-protein ligase PUB23-like [Ipomoea nil]|uniref:E3 ubiquitin-protein ligase PUB23-like n=1 Tax=Ipomoea nil TaxID=35883 RepID=UPI000900EB13|nr:PREDICTED: E3 ubiquitin-protein ligase PUB23-like [Ipomoea nil]
MEEIQVPPYFLCPISLEIMKDPVTISTGITYDRDNIEKWIFSGKNATCPVTKQALSGTDDEFLTPNIILRRVIQSWCTLHASHGVERFPTPKPPVTKSHILKLLRQAKSTPEMLAKVLQTLRSMAPENAANKRCMESAGVAEFLAQIIKTSEDNPTDDALYVLHNLGLSENGLRSILGHDTQFIDSLTRVMQHGSYESRAYAVMLLKSMLETTTLNPSLSQLTTTLNLSFFHQVVQILRDNFSRKASKSALHLLANVCQGGRNRIKAAEAGAATVVIDLLLDTNEKRYCEWGLSVLEQLCRCAEGRAEVLKHAAGLAVVSRKILRVSQVANERGLRILYSIAKFSATPSVVQEMLQLGVGAKLCLVIQVDCGVGKNKERAAEILKLHAKEWKNSPCLPLDLIHNTIGVN